LKNRDVFNGYHGFVPKNYTDKDLTQERRYNIGLIKIERYIQYHIDEICRIVFVFPQKKITIRLMKGLVWGFREIRPVFNIAYRPALPQRQVYAIGPTVYVVMLIVRNIYRVSQLFIFNKVFN
jgi:hypothetical protein